jgi:hypothetical protein
MYGGAVNRFGGGMGGGAMGSPMGSPMDGAMDCYGAEQGGPMPGAAAGLANAQANGSRGANGGVIQASFNDSCDNPNCTCEPCQCGENCTCGAEGAGVIQAGFHHGHPGPLKHILGHGDFVRPGSVEAYAADAAMAGAPTSQIAFLGDDGIQVSWDVGGYGMFDSEPLVIPGRQDFYQGAIYRLRLSNIPGRPGVELFPTLEIAPVTPRTDAYLAHSPIPVQFTEEDFDQVTSGNFVTKVIYLPDPEFQELALAGVETLVSTRLDPGVDPIAEADRRGSILAILRIGNKDLRRGAGMNVEYDSEVVPASHTTKGEGGSYESQALYKEELDAAGKPTEGGVTQAQYCGPYGEGYMGDGSMGTMPMGMPTSGFAPTPVPPNMLAGAPQWGMPITGTPIGLPGPPHVPLGVPAGLQQHHMKNKTRVKMPPPVAKMHMTVKHRPGLNYPRPVNHVHVHETQREPVRLMPGWLSGMFSGWHGAGAGAGGGAYGADCQ